jgi:hypothetical protein|tara:strand:+ start:343 stop:3600 length:3258 start_codon:yes stop_codon:yes gene_type:complete
MASKDRKQQIVKLIQKHYPDINENGVAALMANFDIETDFKHTTENKYTLKTLENRKGNLRSMNKNLAKWFQIKHNIDNPYGPEAKAIWDKLSVQESNGVLYQGDEKATSAGGYGALQVTSANYGGLQNFDQIITKMAKEDFNGMDPQELLNKVKNDYDFGVEFSLLYYKKYKEGDKLTSEVLNNTTAENLRSTYINPGENPDSSSVLKNRLNQKYELHNNSDSLNLYKDTLNLENLQTPQKKELGTDTYEMRRLKKTGDASVDFDEMRRLNFPETEVDNNQTGTATSNESGNIDLNEVPESMIDPATGKPYPGYLVTASGDQVKVKEDPVKLEPILLSKIENNTGANLIRQAGGDEEEVTEDKPTKKRFIARNSMLSVGDEDSDYVSDDMISLNNPSSVSEKYNTKYLEEGGIIDDKSSIINAYQIIEDYKNLFPKYAKDSNQNTKYDIAGKVVAKGEEVWFDTKISKKERESLEANILKGSKLYYEKYGKDESRVKGFFKDDDKARENYFKFLKEGNYLSYTTDDGETFSLNNMSNNVEDMWLGRGVVAHFINTVSGDSANDYANLVTGEDLGDKSEFKKLFDTSFKNMLQDSNFNMSTGRMFFMGDKETEQREKYKKLISENPILKKFVDKNGNFTEEFLAKDPVEFDNLIQQELSVVANQFRTSPDQSISDIIESITGSNKVIDAKSGVITDEQGNEVKPITDLSALTNEQLVSEMTAAQNEIKRLESGESGLEGDEYANALQEQKTMLADVTRENKSRADADASYRKVLQSDDTAQFDAYRNQISSQDMTYMLPWQKQLIDDRIAAIDAREEELGAPKTSVVDGGGDGSGDVPLKKGFADTTTGKVLGALGGVRGLANTAMGLLALSQGRKHVKEAMKDIPVEEGRQLDAAWKGYMAKMREAAQSGMSAEQKAAAQSDLSTAYNLGVKNVARASGGNRAMFLANAGVLNANRIKGLLKLNAMDAKMQQDNLKALGTAVQYQNEHGRMVGEIDRKMAYSEAERKSALHGSLGNEYIKHALGEITYATEKANNAGQMAAFQRMLEQQNISSGLTRMLEEAQATNKQLQQNITNAQQNTNNAGG